MRAEVAAVSRGATGLTWYGTVVAAVEAVGVASAALLPRRVGMTGCSSSGWPPCYVLALLPTVVVAGAVARAARPAPPAAGRGRARSGSRATTRRRRRRC